MDYVQRRIKIPKDAYKKIENVAEKQKTSKHNIIVGIIESHFKVK